MVLFAHYELLGGGSSRERDRWIIKTGVTEAARGKGSGIKRVEASPQRGSTTTAVQLEPS